MARRRFGLSQQSLANLLGVRRSAVGNWEAVNGTHPSCAHLERLACVLQVPHEWLTTGRGDIGLPMQWDDTRSDSAIRAEDRSEAKLLRVWRTLPGRTRAALLEMLESIPQEKCKSSHAEAITHTATAKTA
jgi:transcriptional regulator with XRE-family HTH domain